MLDDPAMRIIATPLLTPYSQFTNSRNHPMGGVKAFKPYYFPAEAHAVTVFVKKIFCKIDKFKV